MNDSNNVQDSVHTENKLVITKITNQQQLDDASSVRQEVFVKEQGVAADREYDEFDSLTAEADHVVVYDGTIPVGTGRVRLLDYSGPTAKLERICVLEEYRQYGLGRLIVDELERLGKARGAHQAMLNGQTQAEPFYIRLGYKTVSEVFLEEGIPHVKMVKSLG
ncbi:GNAT family N-acetyltransferase [Paenibacillus sp. GCM10023252]|uniref:GNAT family N-acetyltransferase n=1 Tax=Paenibacillus sp. GCM10023252 TaxID=3252649 RepID=UPI003606003F